MAMPPEYVYHDRTAWCCAVFVGKRYGSKGYPQRNDAHVRWTLPVTSNSLLKHLSGESFPDDDTVGAVRVWFRQKPQEFYAAGFQGHEMLGQVFKFVWILHWKICCLYVIIPIRLFSITICNLPIDFPSYLLALLT